MTGRTHLAVGAAVTLFATQPGSVKELVIGLAVASMGSVISDIDVSTSESHEDIDKVIGISVFAALITAFIEYRWNIGIDTYLMNNTSVLRLVVGIALFLGVCVYGKEQPHRSFMHSIPAVLILSGIVYIIWPVAAPFFAVSMLSHIVMDILNYKNVRLFYPCKWGLSLDLCHASGLISKLLFALGGIASVAEIFYIGIKIGMRY